MTVLIFGLHEGVTSARRGIIVSFVSVQHCYGSDIYGHVFFSILFLPYVNRVFYVHKFGRVCK